MLTYLPSGVDNLFATRWLLVRGRWFAGIVGGAAQANTAFNEAYEKVVNYWRTEHPGMAEQYHKLVKELKKYPKQDWDEVRCPSLHPLPFPAPVSISPHLPRLYQRVLMRLSTCRC